MHFEDALRKGSGKYTLFSVSNTKRCVSVFHRPKSQRPMFSTKTTHFCILFVKKEDGVPNSLEVEVPLLALEVFTYLDFYADHIEKLVYVSKADTTGLEGSQDVNVGAFVTVYISSILKREAFDLLKELKVRCRENENESNGCSQQAKSDKTSIFMSETQHRLHILERRAAGDVDFGIEKPVFMPAIDYIRSLYEKASRNIDVDSLFNHNIQTKLVMFTRSESQYLFPESMKNSRKHVLDGTLLLKWWLKNVDRIVAGWEKSNTTKWLDVLNMDKNEIERFFPTSDWKVGNVYTQDSASHLAIHSIPLLPDDPKGRFLEHLVVEGRAKKTNCLRYWQELAIRQEFRFGAVVGIIGVSGVSNFEAKTPSSDQFVTSSIMAQFNELITSKDYSDKSDWGLLFTEMMHIFEGFNKDVTQTFVGKWEPHSAINNTKTLQPVVNTLMVRSRKKQKKS